MGQPLWAFEPKNRFVAWFDAQLPILSLLHSSLVAYPTPKNLNYWWSFGSLAGFMLLVQIVTGIFLSMHYNTSADLAFASVEHIMRDVNYGWLLRYVHANGSAFFFMVIYIHVFRGLYFGSYKSPREVLWMLGLIILFLMMATAFMGYVLPWGQMSFWAATVITNLFSAFGAPGDWVVTLLWGGFSVDNPTLNRFYSLHYLLPFVIAAVALLHIWALHIPGSNNPLGIDVTGPQDQISFHPYFTAKDLFSLSVLLLIFAFFVFYAPNYMGHPDNYIEADSLKTPPHIVPEWYLLPFYAILRSIPDKLMGVIGMFGSILLLFALPWLDGSKVRSMTFRPISKLLFWILVVDVILLGIVGAKPPEGAWLLVGRLATAWYFLHFLVFLPVASRSEVPMSLPESISQAVTAKQGT